MTTKMLQVPKRNLVFSADGALDGNTITFKANSGRPFKHPFWENLALDLEGMEIKKEVLPILMNHDQSMPIGSFRREDARVNGGLIIHGQLAVGLPASEKFKKEIRAGIPFQSSVHAIPLKVERIGEDDEITVNGHVLKGPGNVFRSWELKECSPCLFGADSHTETNIFSFSSADTLISVDIPPLSEDDKIANQLFALSKGTYNPGNDDPLSVEDEKEAERIFNMTRR